MGMSCRLRDRSDEEYTWLAEGRMAVSVEMHNTGDPALRAQLLWLLSTCSLKDQIGDCGCCRMIGQRWRFRIVRDRAIFESVPVNTPGLEIALQWQSPSANLSIPAPVGVTRVP
jgi:hypothetical protein